MPYINKLHITAEKGKKNQLVQYFGTSWLYLCIRN